MVSTQTGALQDMQYSFASRFETGVGTNPEELIGAAHAGCYSMALSGFLGGAGFAPTRISTTAEVTLKKEELGFSISGIHLITEAEVPNISDEQFQQVAANAKANCPVSKMMAIDVTLSATLL